MSEIATQPFTGTYRAQALASTFAFGVRHSGTFWFRGVMPEVEATLRTGDDGLVLEGAAKVGSISVFEPGRCGSTCSRATSSTPRTTPRPPSARPTCASPRTVGWSWTAS